MIRVVDASVGSFFYVACPCGCGTCMSFYEADADAAAHRAATAMRTHEPMWLRVLNARTGEKSLRRANRHGVFGVETARVVS